MLAVTTGGTRLAARVAAVGACSQAEPAVAVAGGSGFIGSHVIRRLLAAGRRVVVLARGSRAIAADLQPHVELRRCDLTEVGAQPVARLLADCDAVVNLVGIKRPTARQSFEAVHVSLPQRLAHAARSAGVRRFVHVSVAGTRPDPRSPYLDSKARGEQLLRDQGEGLGLTILRPGVVYGRGDDLLRNLADAVRAAPLFPAPGGGRAPLEALAVEDLAEAVLRCLERPDSAGRSYDLVGPERLDLRTLLARVGAATCVSRRCLALPVPARLLRPAAGLLERFADPLITRAQLELLAKGVVGDGRAARVDLGLVPRRLDAAAVDAALVDFRPRLPSVRLVPDRRAGRALAALARPRLSRLRVALFVLVAVLALLLGPLVIAPVFPRMAVLELGLLLLALLTVPLAWRRLWRPTLAAAAWGVGSALVMWGGAGLVLAALAAWAPQLGSAANLLAGWTAGLDLAPLLGLLLVIVAGEELVWRGALGIGLALAPAKGGAAKLASPPVDGARPNGGAQLRSRFDSALPGPDAHAQVLAGSLQPQAEVRAGEELPGADRNGSAPRHIDSVGSEADADASSDVATTEPAAALPVSPARAWTAVALSALAFTVAHLSTGPPLLWLAAAVAGGAWTWLALRSRSLFASFVSHLLWDAAMIWLLPSG